MGKSNRIRNERASDVLFGGPAPKKKKGMPSWALNAITITAAVLLLAGVALLALNTNGVFGRMQSVMKTDNFRVTKNMMTYYAQTQYQSFKSENSSYLSAYGLDTGLSLKDQTYSTDAEGNVKTWYDMMMESTVEQVKEILVYCEAAHAAGFELDEDAKQAVEDQLAEYEYYASMNQTTADNIVAATYGKGMKLKDVRAAVELATLASEYSAEVGTKLESEITDTEITTEYEAQKIKYDLVDYFKYTFSVTVEDAKEAVEATLEDGKEATDAQIIAKYKEMIAAERAKAAELSKITDKAALKAEIIKLIAEETFDEDYKKYMTDKKVPEKEILDIRADLLEKVIASVKDDSEFVVESVDKTDKTEAKVGIASKTKEGETTKYTVLGKDATEAYYNAFVTFADSFYDEVNAATVASEVEGANHSKSDEALEWMFGADADAGEFKTVEAGDTKEDLGTESAKLKSFSATVYYLAEDVYKDEKYSKNLGIIIFSDKEKAKTAAQRIAEMGTITVENLEALAEELGGSFTNYENYTEGSMGVDAFDEWVFADDRAAGSFTKADEVITLTSTSSQNVSTSYATVWLQGNGLMEWEISVKSAIFQKKFEENDTALKAAHAVSGPNYKVLNTIDL